MSHICKTFLPKGTITYLRGGGSAINIFFLHPHQKSNGPSLYERKFCKCDSCVTQRTEKSKPSQTEANKCVAFQIPTQNKEAEIKFSPLLPKHASNLSLNAVSNR